MTYQLSVMTHSWGFNSSLSMTSDSATTSKRCPSYRLEVLIFYCSSSHPDHLHKIETMRTLEAHKDSVYKINEKKKVKFSKEYPIASQG